MTPVTPSRQDLVAALAECIEVLALVERPAFVDPDYGPAVEALGERIGYGALMSSASASWRQKLVASGMAGGGEFVAGPCHSTVVSTLAKARAALASEPEPQPVARMGGYQRHRFVPHPKFIAHCIACGCYERDELMHLPAAPHPTEEPSNG